MRFRFGNSIGIFLMTLFAFTGNAMSETLHGEVRSVNMSQQTIQIVPDSDQAGAGPVTLKVPAYAELSGIESLNELEAGDAIRVEVERGAEGQPTAQKVEVQEREAERRQEKRNEEIEQRQAKERERAAETDVFEADANASENTYAWNEKLSRGVVNFVTSPIELPRSIDRISREEGPGRGWTVGLVQGVGRTLFRAGAGLLETVTFPFNWPNAQKAPILAPEYPWERWEEKPQP